MWSKLWTWEEEYAWVRRAWLPARLPQFAGIAGRGSCLGLEQPWRCVFEQKHNRSPTPQSKIWKNRLGVMAWGAEAGGSLWAQDQPGLQNSRTAGVYRKTVLKTNQWQTWEMFPIRDESKLPCEFLAYLKTSNVKKKPTFKCWPEMAITNYGHLPGPVSE